MAFSQPMDRVHITEVGLRDGLQSQPVAVSTDDKLVLAQAIAECGVTAVEATSFVSPKAVPQMADADALFPRLPGRAHIRYSALTPNLRALDRARAAGVQEIAVVLSATETMNRRNINMGLKEALEVSVQVLHAAKALRMRTRAYVAVAWGCPFEGEVDPSQVIDLAAAMNEAGAHELVIADTIGAAYPKHVGALLARCATRFGAERIAAHFHDTRGFALANVWAAYREGVRRFDASLGGLGGCPFAPGAAGNVATEDVVLMFEGCGIESGIDVPKLRTAIAVAERLTQRRLGGRTSAWLQAQDAKTPPPSPPPT
jgi:hydroxymethylglutaryl-CoA lyase